jgi:diguanylate cyclase
MPPTSSSNNALELPERTLEAVPGPTLPAPALPVPAALAPATPVPAVRGSARLSARELLNHTGEILKSDAASRSVLMVVNLNRSDRLQALAQQSVSRPVMFDVIKRIQAILRPLDRYALVSHEELWLLLADLPNAALGELAARTIQQGLARPIHIQHNGEELIVQLRPTVGAAWLKRAGGADPMVLLVAAADACAAAAQSDERVEITELESDEAMINRNDLERDLRHALQNNDLEVFFQPQIDLRSDACVAVEALIRWTDPKRGAVSPQLIASICEERGMMGQLTQFVLNTALRHQMFWKTHDVDVRVAINISALSLSDPTFPTQVSQALSTWGADPRNLTLELTESSIVQNERTALEFMNQLKALGCHLAIDDFGTGYSSFAYLRQFPLHELKIDQTFVRDITTERGDERIVNALVDLAHTFDMRALAEGVETVEAAEILKRLGCDFAQGYLYSKALSASKFVTWFRERKKQQEQQMSAFGLV